jgi:hypothetical protein
LQGWLALRTKLLVLTHTARGVLDTFKIRVMQHCVDWCAA